METISRAFRECRQLVGMVAAEKDRLAREGFKQTPRHLMDALIDLTKAQVSLEMAVESRVQDIAIEAQTKRRQEATQ